MVSKADLAPFIPSLAPVATSNSILICANLVIQ
jgi:hypothetical protein